DQHRVPTFAVAGFGPDARRSFATGDRDGRVRLWDSQMRQSEETHRHELRALSVAGWPEADALVVASGSQDGKVVVRRVIAGPAVAGLPLPHSDWVRALAVADVPGGRRLISGSGDGTIRVFDAASGDEPLAHPGPVRALAAGALFGRAVLVTG